MCRGDASGGWRPPREYSGKSRLVPQTHGIDEHTKWICLKCTNSNFSKRDECLRCGAPKPFVSNREVAAGSAAGTGLNIPPNIDPSKDWKCTCGNWNCARLLRIQPSRGCHAPRTPSLRPAADARREECFKCTAKRGERRAPGDSGRAFDDEDTQRRKRRAEESRCARMRRPMVPRRLGTHPSHALERARAQEGNRGAQGAENKV